MEYAILFGVFFILHRLWRSHQDRKAVERPFENTTLILSEVPRNVDMKTLVVGQEVWMTLGQKFCQKGKVIDNCFFEQFVPPVHLPEGAIAVEVDRDCARLAAGYTYAGVEKGTQIIIFDAQGRTGTAWEGLGFFDYVAGGWMLEDPRSPGNWELVFDTLNW